MLFIHLPAYFPWKRIYHTLVMFAVSPHVRVGNCVCKRAENTRASATPYVLFFGTFLVGHLNKEICYSWLKHSTLHSLAKTIRLRLLYCCCWCCWCRCYSSRLVLLWYVCVRMYCILSYCILGVKSDKFSHNTACSTWILQRLTMCSSNIHWSLPTNRPTDRPTLCFCAPI